MTDDADRADPFPRRRHGTVRVDSDEEARAFLDAYPPLDGGVWRVAGRLGVTAGGRAEEHVTLVADGGARAVVRFEGAAFADGAAGTARAHPTLDELMRSAVEFARENGPHHPGSLARFPVPSPTYPGRVAVPLAILAVDRGRRGLYAPARVAVLAYPAGEPVGVGEFPGFAPDNWPPPRLGDWPPAGVVGADPVRLGGMVARFGGCWTRLLAAWMGGADYLQRTDEGEEARALLGRLDPPGMGGVYGRLNPGFWASLDGEPAET